MDVVIEGLRGRLNILIVVQNFHMVYSIPSFQEPEKADFYYTRYSLHS